MGMGRAGGAFQNASNNVQSGMGGKGKGGGQSFQMPQQQQGGMGGKGLGRFQQQPQNPYAQPQYQPPMQQNPYAQQYYQPQFQPQTFNNPYAQGGFGQQMGGFGGKGGQQMGGMSDLQRLAPNMQPNGGSYQEYVNRPTQEMKMSEEQWNAQRQPQMSGMGGKGGQMGGYPQRPRGPHGFRGAATQGLAALQQPTATTQALEGTTAAPEQPYMGNYLA